jgi:hypothetical protein
MASKKIRHIPQSAGSDAAPPPSIEAPAAGDRGEFPAKAFDLGLAHLTHAFDFTTKLINARDVDEVLALQNDFAKEQASRLKAQASEMNEFAVRTARGVQETLARSMKEWAKPAA